MTANGMATRAVVTPCPLSLEQLNKIALWFTPENAFLMDSSDYNPQPSTGSADSTETTSPTEG
jgi:hypothetical protein